MFVCVFCERTFNLAPHSCPNCNDYKGLMTIEEADAVKKSYPDFYNDLESLGASLSSSFQLIN